MRVNRTTARHFVALCALCGATVAGACARGARAVPSGGASEVRQYLGDAQRAGTAGEALSRDPRELWRASAGRGTLGAVALGDSVAVVASVDRWVSALRIGDGRPYWHRRLDAPLGAGALIGGGRVFAAEQSASGRVVALRLRDGKRVWRRSIGGVASPLLLDGETVYGVSRAGMAFALRADDGRVRWQRGVGAGSRSGPILLRGRIALVTVADTFVVLDAATGRVEGRRGLAHGVGAPLARIDDSTIAVASPSGLLTALALPGGEARWRVSTGAPVFGAPVVARDTVFVLTNRCTLWAVPVAAPASADTLPIPTTDESRHLPCTTVAAPGLVRDGVLVATIGGALLFVDRGARRTVWSRQLPGELRHPPAIRNGQMVVAPLLGDVVSYR